MAETLGPHFHPTEDLLMDAAAGLLCPVTHLVVLTHCSLCPACCDLMSAYELVGDVLSSQSPHDHDDLELECSALPAAEARERLLTPDPVLAFVPGTLLTLALEALEHRGWHELMPGLSSLDLDGAERGDQTEVTLLRFDPGVAGPWHTHNGTEAKVVLAGTLSDHRGTFARGDIVVSGPDITHAPVAGSGEFCYCLSISDAPALLVAAPDVIGPNLEATEIT